jgi:hypothetical protein
MLSTSRIAWLLFVVVAIVVAPSRGDSPETGFVSIFNGKDLSGWEGKPGWWTVEDGAITGTCTPQQITRQCHYLIWRGGKVGDFELRALFRLSGEGANSGIQFRSRELSDFDVSGYQADMENGPELTGTLYDCNGRGTIARRGQKVVIDEQGNREVVSFADPAELQKIIRPGEWNEYRIIARGPEITLIINGTVMSRMIDRQKDKATREGIVALQLHPYHASKVQFKNLQIKNLN